MKSSGGVSKDTQVRQSYPQSVAIHALVFDLFDTLVDLSMESLPKTRIDGRDLPSTAGGLYEEVSTHTEVSLDDFWSALIAVDREHRIARYRDHREFPTVLRFEILCENLELTESSLPQRLTDIHMGMIRQCASLPDHHPEILEALSLRVPLALCSNFSDSSTAQRLLDEYGIARHLEAIVISEDVGLRKPHAGIFEAVLGELGVAPENTLHVGDNLEADVAGAGALGIQTGWLTRRIREPKRRLASYEGTVPTYQLNDLSEILPLVEGGTVRSRP